MADNDSKQPIRSLATDNTTEIADSAGTTINPAKEDGHLATIDTSTSSIDTKITTTANGIKVDGSAVTQPVSATSLPLPTGASTSALQTTGNSSLSSIDGKLNSLGQKTMAASVPVVLASDQSAIPVTISGSGNVELPQYSTAAAVASNASSTQSYTPGSTVSLDGFDAGASGQAKWEFQYGTTGSETTKVVKFTSKGDLNVQFRFPNPISITTAMTVKLIRTNMDNQSQDLYSTIQVH